jgi:hypothetical protein
MKLFIATLSVSMVLPGIALSNYGQAAAGGGAAAGGAGIRGSATASGATAAPTGRVAPAGVPTAQAATAGSTFNSPASGGQLVTGGQTIAPPATATPAGTLNPGQISASPPHIIGRTFDRVPLVGAPTDTVIDPAGPQPTFRFPPPSTLPQAVVTNTGIGGQFDSGLPEAALFPRGNPVGVGNTVGTNFGGTRAVSPEPVVVNLPPGARITTNAFGAAEIGVPPVGVVTPTVVPANTGRGPTFDSSSSRSSTQPIIQPNAPPRNAPIAPR